MRPLARVSGPSIALVIALVAVVPSRANHATETRSYVAGPGDAIVLLCSERPSLGGACFGVPTAHASVRMRILDMTGLPVGGAYRFEAADGSSLARGSFCSQATVTISAGARTLTVFVDGARSVVDCPAINGQVPGTGTTGDITATWLTGNAPVGGEGGGPSGSSGAAATAGSGTFGASSCLTLAGAVSHGAGRSRWLGAYWSSHAPTPAAGVCDDGAPHADLTITCVEGVGPDLFVAARGTDNRDHLARIWDGGVEQPDYAGVMQGVGGADRCGAAIVPMQPVTTGAFVVAASP